METSRELYDTLQVKLKVAGVTAGLNSSYISVVDPAEVPATPIEPKVQSNLMIGLFGGLITGLLLAFMAEAFDDTVSNSAELELCAALPVLCSIPFNQIQGRLKAELRRSGKGWSGGSDACRVCRAPRRQKRFADCEPRYCFPRQICNQR